MNIKSIAGVIIIAVVIGVVYVLFEKNFTGGGALSSSGGSSAQELANEKQKMQVPEKTSIITLPSPEARTNPIDGSSDLLNEAESLEMRDYSTYFEELKESVN